MNGEKLEKHLIVLTTVGFRAEISEELQAYLIEFALTHLNIDTDFAVFKHGEVNRTHLEDNNRTIVWENPLILKKCYAKLDDYGEPSTWDERYDEEIADELRKAPNCRFTITLMLAEEY